MAVLTRIPSSIAPYFNRMETLDIATSAAIKSLAKFIDRRGANCKIVAASSKNVAQVSAAFEAGAAAVTLPPFLLRAALGVMSIQVGRGSVTTRSDVVDG